MKHIKIPHLRWFICGLLFCATALSFLDRQVLSVVAPNICADLHIDNKTYSYITTSFLASYAVMFLLGGVLLDKIGTRLGLGFSVLIWTIASALHAVAVCPFHLASLRFLLGAGEGACFPGAAKAVAEWFPAKQRALAVGIAIGGSSIGAVIAPPLTVILTHYIGWRGAFAFTGLLGLLWVIAWFIFYYTPSTDSDSSIKENKMSNSRPYEETNSLSYERTNFPVSDTNSSAAEVQSNFNYSAVIGLALARFLFDPVFYFYMFWIPKYLNTERGLSLETIGALTWIPFFALGVSNILGGFVSDKLLATGFSPSAARKGVMGIAALLTISSSAAAFASSPATAIAMMSLLMFAHGFWITNFVTIIGDIFPKNSVATVMGITGLVGTIGGMFANTGIGFIADNFSYFSVWLVSGLLYPAAFVSILLLVRYNLQER